MPAVTILYPRGFFDATDKVRFMRAIKCSVAEQMDATNPVTRERTEFYMDPNRFIDLVLIPYDPGDAEVTALLLGTIVTYEWPDRMVNLQDRMNHIIAQIRRRIPDDRVPDGMDGISFTFLGKQPGAWAAA